MTAEVVSLAARKEQDETEDRAELLDMLDKVRQAVEAGAVRDIAMTYVSRQHEVFTYDSYENWTSLLGAVTALQHDILHSSDVIESSD